MQVEYTESLVRQNVEKHKNLVSGLVWSGALTAVGRQEPPVHEGEELVLRQLLDTGRSTSSA